jgi:hypothetical protein
MNFWIQAWSLTAFVVMNMQSIPVCTSTVNNVLQNVEGYIMNGIHCAPLHQFGWNGKRVIQCLGWKGNRDWSVGITTDYRLDDGRVGIRVSVAAGFLSSRRHPDRFWVPRSVPFIAYLGLKRSGGEADHWHPTNTDVKETCIYTSTSWRGSQLIKHGDNFTLQLDCYRRRDKKRDMTLR